MNHLVGKFCRTIDVATMQTICLNFWAQVVHNADAKETLLHHWLVMAHLIFHDKLTIKFLDWNICSSFLLLFVSYLCRRAVVNMVVFRIPIIIVQFHLLSIIQHQSRRSWGRQPATVKLTLFHLKIKVKCITECPMNTTS